MSRGKTPDHPPDRWLILGGDSQIGGALAAHLDRLGIDVWATTRRLGVTDRRRPHFDLDGNLPLPEEAASAEVVCLCAGYTSLSICRAEAQRTWQTNVTHTLRWAETLLQRGAFVIFLSSNQVFDGARPAREADEPTCPVSEYGRQKAAVEGVLLARPEPLAVVRLTKVLGARPTLFENWQSDLAAGRTVHPLSDLMFSPVSVALVVETLVQIGRRKLPGIWQISADRDLAYAEVAAWLARQAGGDPALVQPRKSAEQGIPAEHVPRNTTLCTRRLRDELGLFAPNAWQTLAEACGLPPD